MPILPAVDYDVGSSDVYAVIYDAVSGDYWDDANEVLDAFGSLTYSDMVIPLADVGAQGVYTADIPAALPDGAYGVIYKVGSSPAAGDPKIGMGSLDVGGGGGTSAADIADAVLDEALAGHAGSGSLGAAISALVTGVNVSSVSDGVLTAAKFGSSFITSSSFASGAITAAVIAPDAIGTAEFSDAAANKIADTVFSRSMSNVNGSASTYSLYTMVMAAFESSIATSTWTIYQTDGTTPHITRTVTHDSAADPITGVS